MTQHCREADDGSSGQENSIHTLSSEVQTEDSESAFASVGETAPPFVLPCLDAPDAPQRAASLEDYAGKWLILLFYPRDFSFVCPTELTAFSARIEDFRSRECTILGVSIDGIDTHREWLSTAPVDGGLGPLRFPLASDAGGQLARAYRVWNALKQVSTRGLFIIDPDGVLQYSVVHNLSVGRSTDETLRVLDALRTGGLCPASWTRADGTLDLETGLQPGRVLGHYRIRRPLGVGSFGNVFEAWDLRLERPVALKILKYNASRSRSILLQEARAAARLNHPNVCTVYAVDEEDGLPLIVMELLKGQLLTETRIEPGREQIAEIAGQIVAGMSAAHAAGIVHGDLKPSNVMLTDGGLVKILDFGLASLRGKQSLVARARPESKPTDEATATLVVPSPHGAAGEGSTISGTPAYMSPEQALGRTATAASDVFAFGLILCELLTGRRVMDDDSPVRVVLSLRERDLAAEMMPRVPGAWRALIGRLLAREPSERPTMDQIVSLLDGTRH